MSRKIFNGFSLNNDFDVNLLLTQSYHLISVMWACLKMLFALSEALVSIRLRHVKENSLDSRLNLIFQHDDKKSYRFGLTWWWENDRFFIFVWTVPSSPVSHMDGVIEEAGTMAFVVFSSVWSYSPSSLSHHDQSCSVSMDESPSGDEWTHFWCHGSC